MSLQWVYIYVGLYATLSSYIVYRRVAFSLLLIPGCECGAMLSYVIDIQGQTQDSHKPQNESIIKAKNTLTDEVTLDKLSLMKLPNEERVKIIETLAKDWRIVGSQLNFDRYTWLYIVMKELNM